MAKIERTKNATRNIIFGIILKVYQILVPFLMRTAMIYLMGVQYLGLNSLFTSVLQVLNLAELGVGSAMIYSYYCCGGTASYPLYSQIDFRGCPTGDKHICTLSLEFGRNCAFLLVVCL